MGGRPLGLHGAEGGRRDGVRGGGSAQPVWPKEEEGTGGGSRGPKGRTGWRVVGPTGPEFVGKFFSE
jgi:hypothetical protein